MLKFIRCNIELYRRNSYFLTGGNALIHSKLHFHNRTLTKFGIQYQVKWNNFLRTSSSSLPDQQ